MSYVEVSKSFKINENEIISIGYYDYEKLYNLMKKNWGKQKYVDALGEWFSMFGDNDWNGEVYIVTDPKTGKEEYSLRPIYEGVGEPDKDGDYEYYEIVGYELNLKRRDNMEKKIDTTKTNEEVIEDLLNYRAKYDLSFEKLAKKCKVTPQTLINITKGYSSLTDKTKRKILFAITEEGD